MKGEFFEDVWVAFDTSKLHIINIKWFQTYDISRSVSYDHNTDLQKLIEKECEEYVGKQRKLKQKSDNINNWGGYADKKSSRNGTLNEVLGKKP